MLRPIIGLMPLLLTTAGAPSADLATDPARRDPPTLEAIALADLRKAVARPCREVCADFDLVALGLKRCNVRTSREHVDAADTVWIHAKTGVVAEI